MNLKILNLFTIWALRKFQNKFKIRSKTVFHILIEDQSSYFSLSVRGSIRRRRRRRWGRDSKSILAPVVIHLTLAEHQPTNERKALFTTLGIKVRENIYYLFLLFHLKTAFWKGMKDCKNRSENNLMLLWTNVFSS